MINRTRSFAGRGTLGILIIGGGGIACIAFPPACPAVIGIGITAGLGILYDGVDMWADIHNFSDILDFDLRECCRQLKLRTNQ